RLTFGEGDGVAVCAIETASALVEILIEVLRLYRRINKDVGFRNRRARNVIGAERPFVPSLGSVHTGRPQEPRPTTFRKSPRVAYRPTIAPWTDSALQ